CEFSCTNTLTSTGLPESITNLRGKMISETNSTEAHPTRVAFVPLQPKRRSKSTEVQTHEPVLVNARMELRRHRDRMKRSGRLNIQWRRGESHQRQQRSDAHDQFNWSCGWTE